tara:strand:+ start:317 stop:460 length:144 start_codon:yes stop_codon:yes gene_type:complete
MNLDIEVNKILIIPIEINSLFDGKLKKFIYERINNNEINIKFFLMIL